jgi:hypothetical protein
MGIGNRFSLTSSILKNLRATAAQGGGIYIHVNNSNSVIEDVEFRNCSTVKSGGGIYSVSSSFTNNFAVSCKKLCVYRLLCDLIGRRSIFQ